MTDTPVKPPRRLTLLIPGLTGGGAERVMARMANHWAAQGDHVTLVTLSGTADDAYQLDSKVQRVALDLQATSHGIPSALTGNWRRVRAVRRAIDQSRADVVISFLDQMNVITLLATIGRSCPVIVSERVDARYHTIGTAWNTLRQLTYPHSSCLVVQTEALAQHYQQLMRRNRIEVIPNGVEPPAFELLPMAQRRKVIVAAGRLVQQKGFDLLIEAFALVAQQHAAWCLEIYGTGPLHDSLQEQIDRHGLADRIALKGWCSDLQSVLARSSLFVLSSRYEGFPNVLLDAMACGAACAGFACPSGPEEIIRDSYDGLLVEPQNVEQLAASLGQLLGDEPLRAQLGTHAREVAERFSCAQYFARWEALLGGVLP
jgi:glycosyltransferase involved in cell wall biosynthesis